MGLWTRTLVAMMIATWSGVGVSVAGRLLHILGLSPQRPVYRAIRRDEAAVDRWRWVTFPQIRRRARGRGAVKMVSAIASGGTLRYRLDHGVMDRWAFPGFCAQLSRVITRPIFLIVDGSSIRTARPVRDFVARTGDRLHLFFRPAYAPDLNPDEWVNQNVKARVAREAVADEHELAAAVHHSMRRLQKRPGIVRTFFTDSHLASIAA